MSCHEESCEPKQEHCHEQEQKCDMPEKFLALADEAWMEVLKCKIKANIEANCGKEMEELAKLIGEANKARWQHKFAGKHLQHDYEAKLKHFFMSK